MREAIGEDGAGETDLVREGLERPRLGGAPMHELQHRADLRIAQTGEPSRRFRGQALDVLAHGLYEHELAQLREQSLSACARIGLLLQGYADQIADQVAALPPSHDPHDARQRVEDGIEGALVASQIAAHEVRGLTVAAELVEDEGKRPIAR